MQLSRRRQAQLGIILSVVGAAITFSTGYLERFAKDSGGSANTGPLGVLGSIILGLGAAAFVLSRRRSE